jgi:hypothetical protein
MMEPFFSYPRSVVVRFLFGKTEGMLILAVVSLMLRPWTVR